MPPCLTLSDIRYVSRVKWSNPGKGVAPSPAPRCSSYRKGSLRVALDYCSQLYFTLHYGLKHKMYTVFWKNIDIWELIFIYCGLFVLILVVFCVVSSFTTFWPNFTSGLLQVILPRPRIKLPRWGQKVCNK